MSELAAIVLCGGESRRMGRPKAWLDFGGEKLLQRVVRLAACAADPVVVVAAAEQDLPPLPPQVIVAKDAVHGRGPLEGFAAGLAALPEAARFAYVTATDAPFLSPDWITLLRQLIGDHDVALAHIDGRSHPLSALYRVRTVRPAVESLLAEGRLRVHDLVDRLNARLLDAGELDAVDPGRGTLRNINTPEDYQAMLSL
ncbi:MAG TPA: molybdenum cofactor guanylyltransferase [Pirellulales bacterium]